MGKEGRNVVVFASVVPVAFPLGFLLHSCKDALEVVVRDDMHEEHCCENHRCIHQFISLSESTRYQLWSVLVFWP